MTTSGEDESPTQKEENEETGLLVNDKYRLVRKVGNGSFGVIYFAVHVSHEPDDRGQPGPVAVKLEPSGTKRAQLPFEGKLYRILRDGVGIPKVLWSGRTGPYNALVMQYLGPSLEDLFNFCSRRFSLQTTLMLAEQMIDRIEFVHGKSIVHRDIKPNNFLMGTGSDSNKVYVIDFGLAKFYRDPNSGEHIPYRSDKGLTGTARYASVRNHRGKEQSRRDDLETLGYVLVYFVRGRLPWQGLKISDKQEKYDKIRQLKESTPIDKLCKGCPKEFCDYIHYCRNLKFEQTPDYLYLKTIFRELYRTRKFPMNGLFDWKVVSQPNSQNNHGQKMAERVSRRNTGTR